MSTAMRDFSSGVRMLGEGFALMARHKRLWLVGTLPALLAFLLVTGTIILIGVWAGDLVAWATPFADDWDPGTRDGLRLVSTAMLMIAVIGVAVITFSAVTLLIGGPFYEYIAEQIEDRIGNKPPGYHTSWLRMFVRGLRDSALLVSLSVLLTLPLFCFSFIPLVGQTVIPVVAACVGGWILAMELVGVPFHRRGLRLGDRHRALRTRPALALGFGVPTYLLCAIPFVAIVVIPAATAGGTLLARAVLNGGPPYPVRSPR
jgi:CysZ protein